MSGQSAAAWRKVQRKLGVFAAGSPQGSGFTIIEVMIVLIVSGALFISAAVLISGRQNQTAFDQAIRQIHSEIQQTVNDVAVGYFPDTNFRCTAGGSGPSISTGTNGQGTNSGCVFLGKAMQFKLQSTDPEQFAVYSIAGLQQFGQQETQNLAQAAPKAIAPSSAEPGLPDLTTISKLQSGLATNDNTATTKGMWFNHNGVDTTIGSVAFINSLASYDAGGGIKSGIQQVVVYPVGGSALGATQAQGADAINSLDFRNPTTSPPDPSGGVYLCFASAGTDQSGLIKIGGNNRTLSVTLKIYRGKTCT